MNFASLKFWLFLYLALILISFLKLVSPKIITKYLNDRVLLCLISLTLFCLESFQSFVLFLIVAGATCLGLELLSITKYKDTQIFLLFAIIAIQISPLIYYKYGELIGLDFEAASPSFFSTNQLIPIGISFYTFQLIGILIDRYRHQKKRLNYLNFLNFASFFPQIVAGPIEKEQDLLPAMEKFQFRLNLESVSEGIRWIILGLFYKLVVADNLAAAMPWIHSEISHPLLIHLANIGFGLRIYFDFAGYGFIALGLGKTLNVPLQLNFMSPYCQSNIQSFWRSWHRTLTNWFRDYIYIPLGGNRTRFRLALILLVFGISGLWHGAGINFLIWGLYHGFLLCIFNILAKKISLPKFIPWVLTMIVISFSWLFFYESNWALLLYKIHQCFSLMTYLTNPYSETYTLLGSAGNIFFLGACLFIASFMILLEWISLKFFQEDYAIHRSDLGQFIFAVLIIFASSTGEKSFIYFNF